MSNGNVPKETIWLTVGAALLCVAGFYMYLFNENLYWPGKIIFTIGLIFIIRTLRESKQPSNNKKATPRPIVKNSFNQTLFITGLLVVLGVVVLIYGVYTASKHYSSNKDDKYMSCMIECEDAGLTKTQESICKVDCIKKYK